MAGTILPAISFALNLSTFSMEYMDALKFCGVKIKICYVRCLFSVTSGIDTFIRDTIYIDTASHYVQPWKTNNVVTLIYGIFDLIYSNSWTKLFWNFNKSSNKWNVSEQSKVAMSSLHLGGKPKLTSWLAALQIFASRTGTLAQSIFISLCKCYVL